MILFKMFAGPLSCVFSHVPIPIIFIFDLLIVSQISWWFDVRSF